MGGGKKARERREAWKTWKKGQTADTYILPPLGEIRSQEQLEAIVRSVLREFAAIRSMASRDSRYHIDVPGGSAEEFLTKIGSLGAEASHLDKSTIAEGTTDFKSRSALPSFIRSAKEKLGIEIRVQPNTEQVDEMPRTISKMRQNEIPIELTHGKARTKYTIEAIVPKEILQAIGTTPGQPLYWRIEGENRIIFELKESRKSKGHITISEKTGGKGGVSIGIIIPAEARKTLEIKDDTPLHVTISKNRDYFVLQKADIQDKELSNILTGNLRNGPYT